MKCYTFSSGSLAEGIVLEETKLRFFKLNPPEIKNRIISEVDLIETTGGILFARPDATSRDKHALLYIVGVAWENEKGRPRVVERSADGLFVVMAPRDVIRIVSPERAGDYALVCGVDDETQSQGVVCLMNFKDYKEIEEENERL
ncbi:MAG TPA: hypothetical protein ENL27_01995 [Candidatus Parcubacteria bacterium]|nr:hypothetical protein [Candidatus Parcubacteria bacterium]